MESIYCTSTKYNFERDDIFCFIRFKQIKNTNFLQSPKQISLRPSRIRVRVNIHSPHKSWFAK